MNKDIGRLAQLKAELLEGISVSKQGSYERRLPAAAALPKIRSALKGLRAMVSVQPGAEAWRLLALAEEVLLHYPAAVVALESAIALAPHADRKELKRLALLRQYAAAWQVLGMTPETLRALGSHLELALPTDPCDHTHRHTTGWLSKNGIEAPVKALQCLKNAGGFCDCEVLLNVV